jgi:NitT/TauT family transport system substrate-binding protein
MKLKGGLKRHAAALAVAMGLTGLAGPVAAATDVSVAIISFSPYAPWYIVQEKNLAKDIDLDVRIIEGIAAKNAALQSGTIQCMNNTLDSIVSAKANGVPMQVVAFSNMSYGLDKMTAREGIDGPEDFKGASYGADLGFLNHMWMLLTLERAGLSYDSADLVVLLPQESAAAFLQGAIDIDVNYLPFAAQSLKREGAHVLKSSLTDKTWERGLIGDVIACHEGWLKDEPEVAKELLRAWFEAVDWWKENPEEGNRIVAEGLGWDEGDVRLNQHGAVQLNLKQNLGAFGLEGGEALCKNLPEGAPRAPADAQGWGSLFNGEDCVNGYAGPTWDLFNMVYNKVDVAGSIVPAEEGLNSAVVAGLRDDGVHQELNSNKWIGRLELPKKYQLEELWQGIYSAGQ